jgi:hypothetical protein
MKKCDKCEPFETGFINSCKDRTNCIYGKKVWDDKFGLLDSNTGSINLKTGKIGTVEDANKKKVIEGVGADAEVVTNANGGMQSKSPMMLHLVDADFLFDYLTETEGYNEPLDNICTFMTSDNKEYLIKAVINLADEHNKDGLIEISKVLEYGATKGNNGKGYPVNNWRLIPQEEHINHALIHLYAHITGDTQDDHIGHCMCRLMMAYATEKSENFSYNTYISKGE